MKTIQTIIYKISYPVLALSLILGGCSKHNTISSMFSNQRHKSQNVDTEIDQTEKSNPSDDDWKQKKDLFKLSFMKDITLDQMEAIEMCIKERNDEFLEKILMEIIQEKGIDIEDVEDEIGSDYEDDLYTLCAEVIDKKPKEDYSLGAYWGKEKEFFLNKTLYLSNTIGQNYDGLVDKCKYEKENILWIKLKDRYDTELYISNYKNKYNVKEIKSVTYPFLRLFENALFERKDNFMIICKNNIINIPGGNYIYQKCTSRIENPSVADSLSQGWDKLKKLKIPYKIEGFKVVEHYILNLSEKSVYKIILKYENPKDPIKHYSGSKKKLSSIEIIKNNTNKIFSAKSNELTVGMKQLNNTLKVKKQETKEYNLSKDNIQIHDERDESAIKLKIHADIEEKSNIIINKFLGNREFMENECDKLIKQKRILVSDLNQKECPIENIGKELSKLVDLYSELNITITPDDILNKIMEDVLISSLLKKEELNKTEETLALLQQSYVHIEKIKGKRIFILLGNTGAGKSTLASYLRGDKLEYFINKVGEKAVRKIHSNKNDEKEGPQIGQSIGTSETVYAQSFEAKSKKNTYYDTLIVDSPGFEDTRSDSYELCTNLSIDQAIIKSGSIVGIGLVIPLNSFLIDRGNIVANLYFTMKEKFPEAFDHKSDESNLVQIFITKEKQCTKSALDALISGTRTKAIIKEISEQMELHKDDVDLYYSLEDRKKVWQFFDKAIRRKNVLVVNLKNKIRRKDILSLCDNTDVFLNKQNYKKSLDGNDLRGLRDVLNMSFHTWREIFKEYLNIPSKIKEEEDKLKKLDDEILKLRNKIETDNLEIKNQKKEKEKLTSLILKLSEGKLNEQEEREVLKEVGSLSLAALNSELERAKRDIIKEEKEMEGNKKEIKELDEEEISLRKEMKRIEAEIEAKKEFMQEIADGFEKVNLYKYSQNIDVEMTLMSYDKSSRRKAHEEGRYMNDDEQYNSRKVMPLDYIGKLTHDVIIEKQYRLCDSDKVPELIDHLDYSVLGNAKYLASDTGKKYRVDYEPKYYNNQKKVMYGFETTWDGKEPLPHFEIIYHIPKIEYNRAEIINLSADISKLKNEKNNKADDIRDKISNISNKKNRIKNQIIPNIDYHKKRLIQINNDITKTAQNIKEMKLKIQSQINNCDKEAESLKNSIDQTETEIKQCKKNKSIHANNINELDRKKNRHAFVIYKRIETIRFLKEFTEKIIDPDKESNNDNIKEDEKLKFLEYYNKNIDDIKKHYIQDLKLL